jgi:hypothetical protein
MQSAKSGGLEAIGSTKSDGAWLLMALSEAGTFSDIRQNKFRNTAIDIDYKLSDGFIPYAGISHFNFKESNGKSDSGYVAMTGLRVLF